MTTFSRTVTFEDSSVITSIQYSFDERRLRVAFQSGSVWDYLKVPVVVFSQLAGSISIGAGFNELVRDRFDAKRVEQVEQVTKELPASKRPKRNVTRHTSS